MTNTPLNMANVPYIKIQNDTLTLPPGGEKVAIDCIQVIYLIDRIME